jgi:hypothetical protein
MPSAESEPGDTQPYKVRPGEAQSGEARPNQSEVRPDQSEVRPDQSEVRPNQSEVRPNQSEVRPDQAQPREIQSGKAQVPEDRALARQLRELEARAALAPLGEDERPAALLVGIAVAVALAIGVLVGVASVHDLARHGGSLPGGIFLAGVLALLAWGMYRRRYWAVLGFEALLAFQIIVTSLALVVAETLAAAGLCALSIGLAGWLFWKLVRVMGRIQAGERAVYASQAEATPVKRETDEAVR